MVSWTQIPKEIELVSSEILARQVCNLGKIICQTQMVRTQNISLKHLYLHVLWGTSLARTYLGYPKPLDLDVTSTNWKKHEYPLEYNSHKHDSPPWLHVELIGELVGTSARFPSLLLGGKLDLWYLGHPPISLYQPWDQARPRLASMHACFFNNIDKSHVKWRDVLSEPAKMRLYMKLRRHLKEQSFFIKYYSL